MSSVATDPRNPLLFLCRTRLFLYGCRALIPVYRYRDIGILDITLIPIGKAVFSASLNRDVIRVEILVAREERAPIGIYFHGEYTAVRILGSRIE